MVLCLGEPTRRFLWCSLFHFCTFTFIVVSSFHFCVFICRCSSFFCCIFIHICFSTSSLTFPCAITGAFTPHFVLSAQPIAEWLATLSFLTNPFYRCSAGALRFWVGIFYLQAFFTLRSFTDILTCVYQGFPGSRQFFLEVCRSSYGSSKHRSGPSVCLIHSNPQTS